jgi:hypothetical protein
LSQLPPQPTTVIASSACAAVAAMTSSAAVDVETQSLRIAFPFLLDLIKFVHRWD